MMEYTDQLALDADRGGTSIFYVQQLCNSRRTPMDIAGAVAEILCRKNLTDIS